MHKPICRMFLPIAFLWASLANGAAAAPSTPPPRQAIVIFVDGMSFADLAKLRGYPPVDKWLASAQAAAMTIRSAGPRHEANAYLLMGSGGQALYTEKSGTVYQRDELLENGETAAASMARLQASPPLSAGAGASLLFPGIFRLQAENMDKPFTARIGLLGGTLAKHGMIAAAFGNGDDRIERRRHAALFAIDERGEIPAGDVSARTNLPDPGYPNGLRTHYRYLLDRLAEERRPGLLVVELADLARLYRLKDAMDPVRFKRQYDLVMADLARFLEEVLKRRTERQMVMVTSALVNEVSQKEKSLLTPMLIWRPPGTGGLLTSATTRQPGLISGLDVLPTLLAWLHIPRPEGLIGHVMTAGKEGEGLAGLLARVSDIDRIYANRPSVMYTYVMLQIFILVAAALFWLWQKGEIAPSAERWRRGIRLALLSMLFFPALFLLEPLLGWSAAPPVVLGFLIMLALGLALAVENRSLPAMLLVSSGVTVAGILLDGLTGGEAMRRSYMGYDPVIGARFYGLGNEYEGVVIGAAISFAAALHEWGKGRIAWLSAGGAVLLFGCILAYMALPSLGANAGGFLAATAGFGVTLFRLHDWKAGKKGLLLLAGGLLGGIAALIIINLGSSQPLTHVGRVAQDIVSGNWTEVGKIVERKLEMNWRLIRVSAWSKVFAVSLVVISLFSLRPDRYLRRLSARYPCIVKGFHGVIAGSLAGLVLNDSGIVSAATSIIFFVAPALYAALGHPADREYTT
ncbi:hypothetical protein G3578_12940 [Brevibacillus sp. SYP-B805]|uniref:hypothetical protein n=1 Tax=Brevibacillus sp. SYP-B805 TaxID=1578199 RepID=UPI0013EC6DDE|nr:hypothetical protein [Brevibacillus sp. SYP-B805]NGQ96065.1 hypothetical protein [Brevibacillus sp. SYP-B805]